MRVPFVCGNWKMHRTVGEAMALVDGLLPRVEALGGVEVGIAPAFTALFAVKRRIEGTRLRLCAQNVNAEARGAFTGEISVEMLKDVGCDYVLVGHSERRQLFGETDEGVRRKVDAVLDGGLRVIVAIGETLEERKSGATLEVVARQLDAAIGGVPADRFVDVVLAYEPVWAIGTGLTATPEQAQEVHAALRSRLLQRHEAAGDVRIQYGGSMKAENAAELLRQPDIDGGLIGGASLDPVAFSAICAAAG